jgi:hypothetical protein
LFLITTSRVLSYVASGKGGATPHVLDDIGAALNCSIVMPSGDVVLARDEAVYVYGPEGRGACYALEGTKSSVQAHGNNLVIVSPPFTPSAASNSATVRDYVARNANAGRDYMGSDISKVSIFDLELKFIAHSGTYTEGVREVFCEWGEVFVLTNDGKVSWPFLFAPENESTYIESGGDGKVTRLEEKPTPDKLSVLFSKNFFLLAISLARMSGCDEADVAEIHRKYGDHLYGKGDFEGAMQQFIKTIGFVQPSYVIRKVSPI